MKTFTPTRPLLTLAIALFAASCAQQSTTEGGATLAPDSQAAASTTPAAVADKTTPEPVIATIKPGAGVTFSHKLRAPVQAGESGVVDLTIEEAYATGILKLETSGTDGLNVFGSSVSARESMADRQTHSWSLNYQAEADGVYYLNVLATVESDNQPGSARAYAIRIEVGDISKAAPDDKVTPPTQLPSGETAIIMEAEETIGK